MTDNHEKYEKYENEGTYNYFLFFPTRLILLYYSKSLVRCAT